MSLEWACAAWSRRGVFTGGLSPWPARSRLAGDDRARGPRAAGRGERCRATGFYRSAPPRTGAQNAGPRPPLQAQRAGFAGLRKPVQISVQLSERERAPEDLAHDLVAAAADRPQARVARGALDPVLAHVAGAAVDLQAGVHQLEARSLGEQLGHRDLADRLLARDEAAQGVVGDAAAGVDLGGRRIIQKEKGLVAGAPGPEGLALAGGGRGAAPRPPQRRRGRPPPCPAA